MAREVVVGPKIPGPNKGEFTVLVTFNDAADPRNAITLTVLLNEISGEPATGYVKRAAQAAQKLADDFSNEVTVGAYRQRR